MSLTRKQPDAIVRPTQTKTDYNVAQTTIRGWEELGLFPKRRKFGPRVSGWFQSEFEQGLRDMASAPEPRE
jgi:predicted DNA-binding transcriptional regulator AlpA